MVSLGLFFIVAGTLWFKIALRHSKDDSSAAVLTAIINSLSVIPFIPFFPLVYPTTPSIYLFLILACFLYAINDLLQVKVWKNLDASVASILNQFKTVFIILLGIILFRESLTLLKFIGACLIITANSLLFINRGAKKVNYYWLVAVVSNIIWAVANLLDIQNTRTFNIPSYLVFVFLVPGILLGISRRVTFYKLLTELRSRNGNYFLYSGLAGGIGSIAILQAYSLQKVIVVAPLLALSTLLSVVFAYFLLKERKHLVPKLIAAVLATTGVILTVFH